MKIYFCGYLYRLANRDVMKPQTPSDLSPVRVLCTINTNNIATSVGNALAGLRYKPEGNWFISRWIDVAIALTYITTSVRIENMSVRRACAAVVRLKHRSNVRDQRASGVSVTRVAV